MQSVSSMMVGFDTTILPAYGITSCLRFKQPVYAAVVAVSIQESPSRPFMPVGVLVTRENLPRDYSFPAGRGVPDPPGLISGRDFTAITSPVAYSCIPSPWSSVLQAVKWANREFAVPVTPWAFCALSVLLWKEDPVTHKPLTAEGGAIPWEVCSIPWNLLLALAKKGWIGWAMARRIEREYCLTTGAVSMNSPIALPWKKDI